VKEKIRPTPVTVVCIIAFIFVIIGFPAIFSPFIKKLGVGYPALFGSILAFNFISLVGTWHMKKWGVYVYLLISLIDQASQLYVNRWKPTDLILPLLFLTVTAIYYKQMDENL
jgi:hypothetical protein